MQINIAGNRRFLYGFFTAVFLWIFLIGLLLSTLSCGSVYERQYASAEQAKLASQAEHEAAARGRDIWFDPDLGTNGRNCESCHEKGDMTNAESYPRYKHILRTMATLSMTHNFAVVNESRGKPWELGSEDANALVLYVKSLANGKRINMALPQQFKEQWIDKGKKNFIAR